jgi:uncharacterized protein (DUF2345 family)
MAQPNSAEAIIKALEARVAKLEKALQVSTGQIVLQAGSAKIILTTQGNIQIAAGINTQITSGAATLLTSGSTIQMNSGSDTQMKAAGNIVMKGNKILQN